MYHGAVEEYKILQPYGLDFGNAFQRPGFSLFTFVNKDDSIGWAIFQVTKKLLEEYGIGKTSGCNWSKEVVLTRDTYNRLVTILDGIPNQKKTYYVYTVKVEKDFVLGFGHSTNTKNCVTIRNKNIVPYKTDRYILTKDALDAHSCIIEREEDFTKGELLKMNGINGRFLTPFMINDPMNNWKVYKQIKQAILSGEITYDDDSLNDYIKKNHIPIGRLFRESSELYTEGLLKKKSKNLFFISETNMNGKTLQPRIPDNFLVKNGYEDSETPRVCFCPTVRQCLTALSKNVREKEFFVHIPASNQSTDIYKPSVKEVPDAKITGEVWIKRPVKIKCIGKIKVTGVQSGRKYEHKYRYGSKTAILYEWNFKYVATEEEYKTAVRIGKQILSDPKFADLKLIYTVTLYSYDGSCFLSYVTDALKSKYSNLSSDEFMDLFLPLDDKFYDELKESLLKEKISIEIEGDEDSGFISINKKHLSYHNESKDSVYLEAKRSELPDEAFGIPEDRKFPLDTKKRVISAIRLFGHAEEGKKKELAKRIAKRAADYGIKISETTQVYKYLHMDDEKEMTESVVVKFDPNHKTKKSSKKFKFIDLTDPEVDKYLKNDSYCKKHINWIHDSAKGEIVVDEDSDTFAGYVFIWKTKNTGFIAPLHVFEKYRGCGLGARLLKDAIQKYDAVDLCVLKTNKVAIKLYKDNGFVIIGDGNNKKEYWMKLKSKLTDEEKTKVITESVDDLSPDLKDIIKVNHKLNYFEYIIVVNGRVITQIKREDFDHYRTMSPREFKKYHGGICWDYAMFEAFYFKKHFPRIKTKMFFTAFECDGTPTHTFLLFYLNNKCYWFESSWKSHCGVYEFDSEDAALTYITKQLRSEKKNVKYTFVTEYNAMDVSLQNLPGDEYVDKLLNQEEYKFSNVYSEMREVFREDIRL